MDAVGPQHQYDELEYTETHNELKADESQDPQTTERNLGIIQNENGLSQLKGANSAEKNGKDRSYGAEDDGDTERRHFSSLPANQSFQSAALTAEKDPRQSYLLDTSSDLQLRNKVSDEVYEEEKKDYGHH